MPMQKSTKKLIGIALMSGAVGYIVGRMTAPPRLPPGERVAPDVPRLQRIAGDLVHMCESVTPIALEIEASLANDREISAAEAYAIMQQAARLM